MIYSWKQTFKANSLTKIYHEYKPLVGGSVALYPDEYNQQFCMDKQFKQGLKKPVQKIRRLVLWAIFWRRVQIGQSRLKTLSSPLSEIKMN